MEMLEKAGGTLLRIDPGKGQGMKSFVERRQLLLEDINRRALQDAPAFVEEEDARYAGEVARLARHLAAGLRGRRIVMLCGPTSSGKTTTALLLRDSLRELAVEAHTVSLDDFYRGREQAPLLENGNYDYEALEALNLDQLQICMQEIIEKGRTELPLFDFIAGRPAVETRPLCIGPESVVIFEGIHALNPVFEEHLSGDSLYKVFINTVTPVYNGSDKWLKRRDIRLVRRMLRDYKFRSSSLENTLRMWPQVVRGENLYMFPYVDTADAVIDTTHAYEPCVLGTALLPLLREVPAEVPNRDVIDHLIEALTGFAALPAEFVPQDSLLREFLGGGLYS